VSDAERRAREAAVERVKDAADKTAALLVDAAESNPTLAAELAARGRQHRIESENEK